jgi:AcrR family transcriptional regulator/predicted transcriptional regulator
MKVRRSSLDETRVIGRAGGRRVSRANRARLLQAAAAISCELGPRRATVKALVARAGLSRGTFYALFADLDSCLAAVLEDLAGDVEAAFESSHPASSAVDGIALGLAGALRTGDADRSRAICCLTPAASHEPQLLAAQARAEARLAGAIERARSELDEGRDASGRAVRSSLAAQAVLRRAREHLGEAPQRRLIELFGELMVLIAGPRLAASGIWGTTAPPPSAAPGAKRPAAAGARAARGEDNGETRPPAGAAAGAGDLRLTPRTREVLEVLKDNPGATNRGLARDAGGVDRGQISKLLRRLEDRGLIANRGEVEYSWSPNTWFLTDRGRELIER